MKHQKNFFTKEDQEKMILKHTQLMAERAEARKINDKINNKGNNNSETSGNNKTDQPGGNTETFNTDNSNKTDNDVAMEDNTKGDTEGRDGDNNINDKKRKFHEEPLTKKRRKINALLDSGPAFSLKQPKYGRYGKKISTVVKSKRIKLAQKKYDRRLKVQIAIERRRIDKQRVEAAAAARRKLRTKTAHPME